MVHPLSEIALLLERATVRYVVIGAHAVNAWIEPRITADVDVTVEVAPDLERLKEMLADAGYRLTGTHGADQSSGPDFLRFVSSNDAVVLELQVAKTAFQREVIRRAVSVTDGPRVATVEDLIVMKLIANRPKDQADLHGLAALSAVDWPYVERWADEWGVASVLQRLRSGA